MHIGLMLQRYLHQSYESFMRNLLLACKENSDLVEVPVKASFFMTMIEFLINLDFYSF